MEDLYESKKCEDIMYLSMILNQILIFGTWASVTSGSLLRELLQAESIPSLMQQIILKCGKKLRCIYSDVDILKEVMCYVYCSRGGLTSDEILTLLTDKYPALKNEMYDSLALINYEFELPSILCNRLGMLTVEHKFVMDAIERTYILSDTTFAELEFNYNNALDPSANRDFGSKIDAGKKYVVSFHVELANMFKVKAGERQIEDTNGDGVNSFPRELRELEYHEREANMRPSVIVAIRCRPFRDASSTGTSTADSKSIIQVRGKTVLLINPTSNNIQEFDKCNLVFDENTSQDRLYQLCGKEVAQVKSITIYNRISLA